MHFLFYIAIDGDAADFTFDDWHEFLLDLSTFGSALRTSMQL